MSRLKLPSVALATLIIAGCGSGGLNFWLYPEPYLAEPEEAIFVAYESHRLQSIDGEEAAIRCWGERSPQAYSRKDVACRLHILPGEHLVVFYPRVTGRERASLSFTALPGKVYGLDWSACSTSSRGEQQTCLVGIMEIDMLTGGG